MKKRLLSLVGLIALVAAVVAPAATARSASSRFALTGEARALEVALGDQGVTLGLALAQVDSSPKALGVGAGQCALLGESPDPNDLPCSDDNTERSLWPGNPGDENPTCSGGLPAPLSDVIDLKVACGSSKSFSAKGLPHTINKGSVAELTAELPVAAVLPVDLDAPVQEVKDQVRGVVNDLTSALQPVLDQAPAEVRDAANTVVNTVLEVLDSLETTNLIKAEIGQSISNVTGSGNVLKVESSAAGARIGILGIPSVDADGDALIQTANPLENGLVIIEVGPSQATATVNKLTADATAAASAAIVTVKVRDITKTEPTYVEVSVAPGETVTVLEGTPAESTITAADSSTKETEGGAAAAADAVRLHLLKGVNGGVKLGLSRSTAAANVDVVKPAPPITKQAPKPKVLPHTGGTDYTAVAFVMVLGAAGVYGLRKRFSN